VTLRSTVRDATKVALSRVPLYRLLPPGDARTYAGILYHAENSSPRDMSAHVAGSGGDPSRFHTTARLAARAALDLNEDELAERILAGATARFPEEAELFRWWAELRAFHGDFGGALDRALEARRLEPGSPNIAALAVRTHYWATDRTPADAIAIESVGRFPRSTLVLWAACSMCRDPDQFHALREAWTEGGGDLSAMPAAVRPLASAAAHSGLIDTAVELYAARILDHLRDERRLGSARKPRLDTQAAWAAMLDLDEVLESTDTPYFFANGTALGLIREGGPLEHDADIDVGIHASEWNLELLLETFGAHPMFLPTVVHPPEEKLGLRHRRGPSVDVFRYYEEGDRIWHAQSFVRWWNSMFSVERRSFRGRSFPVPTEADVYLTENYGAWRIPRPGFDAFVDAPNVEVVWPGYEDYPMIRRAHTRLAEAPSAVEAVRSDLLRCERTLRRTESGRGLVEHLQASSGSGSTGPAGR
jgi:hypothetical protein